jgi:hypothetical protein
VGESVGRAETVRGTEPLSLPWRLDTSHPPFRLPHRLLGVSCTVIEMAVLAVFHPRENVPFGGAIALQFIGVIQLAGTLLTPLVDAWRDISPCLRSPAALAVENLFLRKQPALYRERGIKLPRAIHAPVWTSRCWRAGSTADLCPQACAGDRGV